MNHLPLIIKREYITKVKNKSFLIMTLVTPVVMVVLMAFVAYLSQLNNNTERKISVLDESGIVKSLLKDTETTTYSFLTKVSLADAKKIVEEEESYGLLYVPKEEDINVLAENISFYSSDTPSLSILSSLEKKLESRIRDIKLEESGVDLSKLKEARTSITILQESFNGEKSSKIDNVLKLGFGIASGYLLFMFIIIYGNMIMRSVIEEKTSRIIEIIVSSVKPVQLMLGKIIGTSLAGITQFAIWTVIGGILMMIIPMALGLDMSSVQNPQQQIIEQAAGNSEIQAQAKDFIVAFEHLPIANLILAFLLFFIGGYLLYSSLYAAIGAAVDNETDTQQFIMPILMPLMLAVYVGIFTVIEDPHGTVSTIFSFIPLTSPVVMLMRIPFGVPIWQQLVSFLLLITSFMFAVWIAAKIYRVGILMYGKKPSYKELYKWLKY